MCAVWFSAYVKISACMTLDYMKIKKVLFFNCLKKSKAIIHVTCIYPNRLFIFLFIWYGDRCAPNRGTVLLLASRWRYISPANLIIHFKYYEIGRMRKSTLFGKRLSYSYLDQQTFDFFGMKPE